MAEDKDQDQPDLFADVPGYKPHSFGQPLGQAPATFADQMLSGTLEPGQTVQPQQPQQIQQRPQQIQQQPQQFQQQPQQVQQQPQQFQQQPQQGLFQQGQGQGQLPQSSEIPHLKLPPMPAAQQKPQPQMLPYQYQYQSQQQQRQPQGQGQQHPVNLAGQNLQQTNFQQPEQINQQQINHQQINQQQALAAQQEMQQGQRPMQQPQQYAPCPGNAAGGLASGLPEPIRQQQRPRERPAEAQNPRTPSVWQEKFAEAEATSRPSALSDDLSAVTAPQISRGAAALRAAGVRTREKPEADAQSESSFGVNKQDIIGLIVYNLFVAKNILLNPRVFFQKMPVQGTTAEPLIFLAVISVVAALLRCIFSFSLAPLFADLIMGALSTILGAVVTNYVFERMGGRGDFQSTLRVLCFSKAPILAAFLGFGNFKLGILASLGYSIYLNVIGLSRTQKIEGKRVVVAVVVLAVLGFIFRGQAP